MSDIRRRIEHLEKIGSVGLCNHHAKVSRDKDAGASCGGCGSILPVVYVPEKLNRDEWIELAAAKKSVVDLERMFSGAETA